MMPSFVYITVSGLIFVASMKMYKLKILYFLNEKADFQKVLYFMVTYLLFSKMQVESLKSQAKIEDFFKIVPAFLGSKTVENITTSYSIVTTRNNDCQRVLRIVLFAQVRSLIPQFTLIEL